MKSFFTKLGTLLLCGVAVAMVGCTDFSEDIQAVDKKYDQAITDLSSATDVKVENLQKAIDDLTAKLADDYATKQELKTVEDALTNETNGLKTRVAGLEGDLANVSAALNDAKTAIAAQIAALEQADADNKADLEAQIQAAKDEASAAITQLQANLESQKAALEAEIDAVEKQIVDTKSELDEKIGQVDAKADELNGQLIALGEYLATLEAQVKELKNTLDSLSPVIEKIQSDIAANTDKINELKNTLLSLSDHLATREALIDSQIAELRNTLLSLDVHMAALEASIDARFAEILNTIESLSIHLATLEAQVALNTESAANANAKAEELFNTLLSLSEDYNAEKAANAAKFNEVLATFESLSIHLAQKEAEHEAGIADNSAKIAELKNELVSLSDYLAEAEAADAAKFAEIQNTFLSLSQHLEAEEAANAAKFAEILATFESLSIELDETNAANDAKFAELQNTLLSLSEYLPTVEAKILEVKNTVESLGKEYEENKAAVADSLAAHNAKIYELSSTLISLSMFLEEADLVTRVSALEDDIKAHKAAFETFEALTVDQLETLFARTEQLFGQLEALSPEVATMKGQISELRNTLESLSVALEKRDADVDAKFAEINNTFASLAPEIEKMQKQILENSSTLASLAPVIETMQAQILENCNTLKSLSPKITELEETDKALQAQITELKNELVTLSEYLPTLEKQIAENKGTLDSLSEYLPKLEAELEEKIAAVDSKANEVNGQLVALAEQLPGMFQEVKDAIKAVADRVTVNEGKIADLEEQTAALEEAVKGLEAAREEILEQLEVAKNTLAGLKDQNKDQQDQIGALGDRLTALENAHEDLIERLNEKAEKLDESIKAINAAIDANKKAIEANGASIEANKELIAENAADIIEANTVIAELQAAFEAYKKATDAQIQYLWNNDSSIAENLAKHTDKLMGLINKTNASLDETQKNLTAAIGRIDALEDAVEALEELAATLASKEYTDSEIKRIEDKATAIQNMLLTFITAAEDRANDKIDHLRTLVAEADELIKGLRGDVDELLARVQSMVYVPEWDDHRAPIGYSELYINAEDRNEPVYVMKESVLRYRVHAVAGESDVKAANDIAELYTKNPAAFDYHVEAVKTRAAEADLEIRNIQAGSQIEGADPKFVYVTVVAKNFDNVFFASETREDKKGYSASLILSDGNNNRSTEYTNLFADKKGDLMTVELVNKDGKAWKEVFDAEGYFYLPYDDTKTTIEPFKGAYVQFDLDGTKYTEAEFKAQGYVFSVTHDGGIYYHEKNATRAVKEIIADDRYARFLEPLTKKMGFSLPKKSPATYDGNNEVPSVYFALTSEGLKPDYKATAVELTKAEIGRQVVFIYDYKVNGVSVFGNDVPQSAIEITNRLVKINLEVDVPWTLETAISTIKDSKIYEGPVKATFEYDLTDPNVADKPLEGYSLYSILHSDNIKTTYAPKCPITLSVSEKTVTATLNHGSTARYAFPKPEDNVECNSYVVTKTASFEDIDFVVTVKMNLGVQPGVQELSEEVTFTTAAGANNWLFGYWNALEDAYQKFFDAGYIGYKDNVELGKQKFFEAFTGTSSYTNTSEYLMVNNKPGISQNVNIPFTANNNEDGEHKFQLYHEQLVPNEDGYVDGTEQTIVQKVYPYFQIPFTFTVNGKVELPDYALELDPVRVINRDDEKIVEVYGEIADNNQYTVDVSDLAKYYYVVNKEGTKSLECVNPNDNVTVDFTLSGMNEDTGYNFNGVTDDIDYTLSVDWTKETEKYVLPMGEAVAHWGTYDHTEVGVNAVLKVNGFPIVAKPITLVTTDPLEVALNNVVVEVEHKSGTNVEPTKAKVYQNFVLTSVVEDSENLFNTEAWTVAGLFHKSKADVKYGAKMSLKFNRVYYKDANGQAVAWDKSKIIIGEYTEDTGAYKAGDLDGTVSIKADDGDIQTPIYVEFEVSMKHRIHNTAKEECETSGFVTVTFIPEGYEFPSQE